MGRKVHPGGFRLGIVDDWKSKWFANKADYVENLHQDRQIRNLTKKLFPNAFIGRIDIERVGGKIRMIIHSTRVAVIIGKKGVKIEELKKKLINLTNNQNINIETKEIDDPDTAAQVIAQKIAMRIEKRVNYRRVMKQSIDLALKSGAKGIKIKISGRLSGAEIARKEWYQQGRLPLQTLRADIDYGFSEAYTKYGKLGIKVWVFKGETL